MPSRRTALLLPLAGAVAGRVEGAGKMTLCIHQTTSKFGGYRKMLEGFAKAGVKNAELTDFVLDEFLKTESLGAAKAVLSDLGITAVSAAAVMQDLWLPGPERVASVEMWKKRCDQFAAIGLKKIYCPSVTVRAVTAEDYKATPACIHEAGEIAMGRGLMAMVEFSRVSTHMSTLGTTIKMIRAAGHANVRLLFDFYHFMSGLSRTEDLDTIRAGEIGHVHFQDLPDIPRELLDANTRAIPGDGVGPLVKILRTLVQKGYAGPLSVELFLPVYQNGDPYLIAKEIREKSERVMRAAKVM